MAEIVETKVVPRAPGGSFKLLYAGRLLYWKGVHLAIRALASARSQGTDATLTLVDSGPARRDLEELLCEVLPEGSYEASALQAEGRKARPRKRRANQQPWQLKEAATRFVIWTEASHDPVLTLGFEKLDPYAQMMFPRRRPRAIRGVAGMFFVVASTIISGPPESFFMKVRKCINLDWA